VVDEDLRLARIEERFEGHAKWIVDRLVRHEDLDDRRFAELLQNIRDDFTAFEKLLREAITTSLVAQEARAKVEAAAERVQNTLVRYLVFAACGAVLMFVLNSFLTGWLSRGHP